MSEISEVLLVWILQIQKEKKNYVQFQKFYKFSNLHEIVILLEKYELPNLTQEAIDNIKRPLFIKETELIIKNLAIEQIKECRC